MKPVTMDEVQEVSTRRFSSLIPELDHVFGRSRQYEGRRVVGEEWGIARGKLWALGGDEGVGKTKFYTMVSILLAEFSDEPKKILIFQKEMTSGEYKELLMNSYRSMNVKPQHLDRIYFEQTTVLSRQVEMIRDIKPDLVVDDSFNLTTEPNGETKKGIQQIVTQWKAAMGSHSAAWMIAHLNKDGGLKGNGHLKYMVDACFFLNWAKTPLTRYEEQHPESYDSRYKIRSGKSRQSKSGEEAFLRHIGDHVEVIKEAEVRRWMTGEEEQTPQSEPNSASTAVKTPVSAFTPEKKTVSPKVGSRTWKQFLEDSK